jgi:TldD protein
VRAGGDVRDATTLFATSLGRIASEAEVDRAVRQLGGDVAALSEAPVGEAYAGPVMFEGLAGPQLFAELLAPHLALTRKPVAEPGRPMRWATSELEGRVGSRILPDFISVVDDPTQKEWRGKPLLGYLPVDMEGVVPGPLTVVEKGRLKTFLLTRTPVAGFGETNGRARLPGAFGNKTPTATNLFVSAGETAAPGALKKQLLDLCAQRGKKYGYIVRKMDYPSSASFAEVRALAQAVMQSGGGAMPTSLPILLYRVFPDGKEELVRGMRFRGLTVRSLKDILSASDQAVALDYMFNLAPFSLIGAGGYVAPTTVVAPAVLFEELELEPMREENPRPPIVPPPAV